MHCSTHWCGRGNAEGLSVQQPCAVPLAAPHSKAPGPRERRAAEGMVAASSQLHQLRSLPFGDTVPMQRGCSSRQLLLPGTQSSKLVSPSAQIQLDCGLRKAAACRGPAPWQTIVRQGAVLCPGRKLQWELAYWKVTLARPARIMCCHPHGRSFCEGGEPGPQFADSLE